MKQFERSNFNDETARDIDSELSDENEFDPTAVDTETFDDTEPKTEALKNSKTDIQTIGQKAIQIFNASH